MLLGQCLCFQDRCERAGLARLVGLFADHLKGADTELFNRLMAARAMPETVAAKDESDLIIAVAPHLEDFLGALFGVTGDLKALAAAHDRLAPLYSCKRLFVQRRAVKRFKPDEAARLGLEGGRIGKGGVGKG